MYGALACRHECWVAQSRNLVEWTPEQGDRGVEHRGVEPGAVHLAEPEDRVGTAAGVEDRVRGAFQCLERFRRQTGLVEESAHGGPAHP